MAATTSATAIIVPTFHLISPAFMLAISSVIEDVSLVSTSRISEISSHIFVISARKVSLVTKCLVSCSILSSIISINSWLFLSSMRTVRRSDIFS